TSYRLAFVPIVEQFMNDDIFIGNGWTTREAYRSVAYGVIYDLLHHVRDQLTLQQCHTAINVYSRNLFDESLTMMIHIMTCRLMLNVADSYCKAAEKELNRAGQNDFEI